MFTGITRGLFPVAIEERGPAFLRYSVSLGAELLQGLELGASVSVDGVCQTVTRLNGHEAVFEAVEETLIRTTLGALQTGDLVSIERSATLASELGGHLVAGHVWGTATIDEIASDASRHVYDLWLRVPAEWMKYLLPKGFVAVDGSSLTIGVCEAEAGESGTSRFLLHLVPETLRLTQLGRKQVGQRVNIELDAQTVSIVNTVERVLGQTRHVKG